MIEIIRAAFNAGEIKTFLMQGEYLEILEAAFPVDVCMMDRSGAQLSIMRNAEASYFSRPGKYEAIQITSATAQTVRVFVGSGDAGMRRFTGDVKIIGGEDSKTLENTPAVAVTAVETALAAARVARRSIRFTNIGTNPVAIGAPGITWARRCIILNAGDTWLEESAAALAWAAICDTAQAASITAQEVIS